MLKKLVFVLILALIFFIPTPGRAQTSLTIPAVEVNLWPEYDDPGMLVIDHVTLPAGVSLPLDFKLRIPAVAGTPNAVAAKQPDGSLLNLSYTQQTSGDWNELTITATAPEIQVEYYDPSLKKTGDQRSYTFEWPGDYPATAFSIVVQQPLGARNMSISPSEFTAEPTGADGLTYYRGEVGPVPAGSPFTLLVKYSKTGDETTSQKAAAPLSAPSASSRSGITRYLPWGIGGLGVVLIVGAVVWFLFSRQSERDQAPSRRRRKSSKNGGVPAAEGFVYCHNCGRRATSGDKFCRTCGVELRP
jgi:hypothetical protein